MDRRVGRPTAEPLTLSEDAEPTAEQNTDQWAARRAEILARCNRLPEQRQQQQQNPNIGTLNRYAEALGKRFSLRVVDAVIAKHEMPRRLLKRRVNDWLLDDNLRHGHSLPNSRAS